jgi:hypothetical protein
MKFYQLYNLINENEIRTPNGYVLSPEELEDYENEKSAMYKALFLKDIDAKRKLIEPKSDIQHQAEKENPKQIPQSLMDDDDNVEPINNLRWRFIDRVLACVERAKEANYNKDQLSALLKSQLGDFGLRVGAYYGDESKYDPEIHQATLYSCTPGESVILKSDLYRLDDPVNGEVIRKADVIPKRKN